MTKNEINDEYLRDLFDKDLIGESYDVILKIFVNKPVQTTTNDLNKKVIFWQEKNLYIAFSFNTDNKCIYFRILPLTDTNKEKIMNYLSDKEHTLTSVTWFNDDHKYSIQLIVSKQDYFIAFKNLDDVKNE